MFSKKLSIKSQRRFLYFDSSGTRNEFIESVAFNKNEKQKERGGVGERIEKRRKIKGCWGFPPLRSVHLNQTLVASVENFLHPFQASVSRRRRRRQTFPEATIKKTYQRKIARERGGGPVLKMSIQRKLEESF